MRVRIDRRALLISAASAVTGAGVGAAQTEQAAKVSLPSLDGSLQFDESSRAAATDDFGHIVRNRPESVLLPGSERDVATAIRWAGERGRKVAARGQGHSVYGRAQARDGLVIDMRPLRQVHAIADDHVVVGAGATWREVLEATLPRKLTPPVLTGYLDLSVAGTLVVGGVGDTSFRNGVQSDNVLELDVITGTGQKITCSLDNHTDLFEAMRAGLGQVGIITRATLKLIPAPDAVRFYELTYSDLQSMLVDQRLLATGHRCQGLQGAIVSSPAGWSYKIDAVTYGAAGDATANDRTVLAGLAVDKAAVRVRTLTYLDYLDRLSALERLLRSKGQWSNPHPWLTTFVADSAVEHLVADELRRLPAGDLGPFGQVLLSPLRRSAIASPLLRLPAGEMLYAFNLVRMPATDNAATEAIRLTAGNRAAYERIRAAGGVLYPVSAFTMSAEDWRSHFGPEWTRLRRAKTKFDPDHLLTPGYEMF